MTINVEQEQQRQQYLKAMGVIAWMPLKALPGAAASPSWQWEAVQPFGNRAVTRRTETDQTGPQAGLKPASSASAQAPAFARKASADLRKMLGNEAQSKSPQISESTAADSTVQGAKQASRPSGQIVKADQIDSSATAESTQAAAVTMQPQRPAKATTEVPRFRLAMVCYQDVMVVDELPLQSLKGFTPAHQKLLDAILRSIGLGTGEPRVEVFNWPVVNTPHVDQSPAVARDGVKSQLKSLHPGDDLPLLVLGEQSARYSVTEAGALELGTFIQGESAWQLNSYSLTELLRVPGCKRELWQHLQPIVTAKVDSKVDSKVNE